MREDWILSTIDDAIILMKNGSSARQFKENVGFPITRIETISKETIDINRVNYIIDNSKELVEKHALNYNDILLSHINSDSHLGKTAIYKNHPKVLIHGINLLLLRTSENLNADFINYQIKYLRVKGNFVAEAQRAVNQSSINQRKLKKFPIMLAPLPEQRTIVSKIEQLFSELDNAVNNLKTAKDKLKIYRQAVLKKAFEGELTKEWRKQRSLSGVEVPTADELLEQIETERENHYQNQLVEWNEKVKDWEANGKVGKKLSKPKAFRNIEPLRDNELNGLLALPKKWKWEKIGINFLNLDQGWSPRCENYPSKLGEWGVIKTTAIQANSFEEKNNKKLPSNLIPKKQHELLNGDILITRAGPRVRAGVCCLVKNVRPKLINCDKAYRIKTLITNPEYIVYMLNSPVFAREIEKTKSGISDSGVNLKQDIFLKMPIPICSLEEQTQIVQEIESRLSVTDKVLEAIEENLKKAEALRQSILKKAFEGKLLSKAEIESCKKEPDYEPAGKLLDRIKNKKGK
jgi:type I restriction enzyme, S subunit